MSTESHSPETLAKAAGKVEESYQHIERDIQKKLYEQVDALMSTWSSDSSRAFYSGFQKFDKEFSDVQNSLDNLHKNLVQSGVNYAQNEAEQSAAAQHMQKLIGG